MAGSTENAPLSNGALPPRNHAGQHNRAAAKKRVEQKIRRNSLANTNSHAVAKPRKPIAYWLENKAHILFNRLVTREAITAILLVIPSAATMMLTYYGVSVPMEELGGTLVQKGQALAFALTIGVFAWLNWFYLFGLLYWLRAKRLGVSLAAGLFLVVSIAAIDAPFNMLALGGARAVQMSLADTAAHYEERKEAVFERATIAQRIIPAIRAQGERFARLEEQELTGGAYSGRAGFGKVSAGFGQIAGLLNNLARELDQGLQQSANLQSRISTIFGEMKREVYTPGAIRPRVTAVSIQADQMDDLLGQLAQFDYAVSIAATLSSLEAIFPEPSVSRSEFERTQNAELAMIAEMARPVGMSLQSALAELRGLPTVDRVRQRPLSDMDAIIVYWKPLLPQWLAALFIDLAPAALLLILICTYREVEIADQPSASNDEAPRNSDLEKKP
jgi:hypothetical protein